MIKGFAHVALYTCEFCRTVDFYKNVFGACECGYPETKRKGCFLKLGCDMLEVFESDVMPDGAFKHIAVSCESVDDIGSLYERALEFGAVPYVEPNDVILNIDGLKKQCRNAFVRGIAGEQIELIAEYLN